MKIQDALLLLVFLLLVFLFLNVIAFRLLDSYTGIGLLKFSNSGTFILMLIIYVLILYFIPRKQKAFVIIYFIAVIISLVLAEVMVGA